MTQIREVQGMVTSAKPFQQLKAPITVRFTSDMRGKTLSLSVFDMIQLTIPYEAIKDIAAGIGDAKEYKHRAEVAERALGEFAEHIRCINCPFFERCESSPDSMVYYSTDECFNVYLREAEKELAEERKDD